jgi:hypothetical protein
MLVAVEVDLGLLLEEMEVLQLEEMDLKEVQVEHLQVEPQTLDLEVEEQVAMV